jgi:putative FmdB family regulatory protein
MPIYEYQCESCGHQLETMHSISAEPLKLCPACGKEDLRKLVSAAGFRLKGSGWYVTDFRDNNKKTAGKPAETAAGDASSAGASTADTATPAAAASDSGSSATPAAASSAPAAAAPGKSE